MNHTVASCVSVCDWETAKSTSIRLLANWTSDSHMASMEHGFWDSWIIANFAQQTQMMKTGEEVTGVTTACRTGSIAYAAETISSVAMSFWGNIRAYLAMEVEWPGNVGNYVKEPCPSQSATLLLIILCNWIKSRTTTTETRGIETGLITSLPILPSARNQLLSVTCSMYVAIFNMLPYNARESKIALWRKTIFNAVRSVNLTWYIQYPFETAS